MRTCVLWGSPTDSTPSSLGAERPRATALRCRRRWRWGPWGALPMLPPSGRLACIHPGAPCIAGWLYSKVALPRCGFGGGPRRRNSASAQSDAVSAYVCTACMYCTARTVWNRMYTCTDCQYIRVHIRRPPRRTVPRPAGACTHQTQSSFPPPGRGRTKQDRPDWGATRFLHLPFCFLNGPLRMGLRSPQGRPSP